MIVLAYVPTHVIMVEFIILIVPANVPTHVKMVEFIILIVLVTVLTLYTKDNYVIRL